MKKYCIFASLFGVILVVAGATLVGYFYSLGYDLDNLSFGSSDTDYVAVETTYLVNERETSLADDSTENHSVEFSSADSTNISEIEIDASAANINFYTAYNDCISVVASGKGSNLVNTELTSGKLEIEYGTADIDFSDIKSIDMQSLVNIKDNAPEIDIYIPVNAVFENLSIELASGEITISDLSLYELDIQVAAGNVNLHRLYINNKPDIELVAGDIMITSSYLNNLEIETVSGGDVYFSECELIGETQLDSVAGNTDIYYLSGSVDDYDFDISVLSGQVRINGNDYVPNNDAATNKISVSKVTGDVFIEFEE